MASSYLPSISRKAIVGSSIFISRKAPLLASPTNLLTGYRGRETILGSSNRFFSQESGNTKSAAKIESSTPLDCPHILPSKTSPWLMLPPTHEKRKLIYKFYSMAANKVLSLENKSPIPRDDDVCFIGSSHGWIVLFNPHYCDLFLTHPLSGHHIKLPSIHRLPNLSYGCNVYHCVRNIILSCSPDEEDCRALMSYGTNSGESLAFCRPNSPDNQWIPIGCSDEGPTGVNCRHYESFVYSSRQKLFFCLSSRNEFEAWNLQDPLSPTMIPMDVMVDRENFQDWDINHNNYNNNASARFTSTVKEPRKWYYPWVIRSEEELKRKAGCKRELFLVVDQKSGELYVVTRYLGMKLGADGSPLREKVDRTYPYMTVDFDVHRYDGKEGVLRYMNGSLDGLALLIGWNQGFAIPAGEFSELKPDSIYYTDVYRKWHPEFEKKLHYGGHDIGIFNYKDASVSPCYYPCDVPSVEKIVPAPMWYNPTGFNFPIPLTLFHSL